MKTKNFKTELENAKKLANDYQWNGDEVISLFLTTLTECNYHSEVKAIRFALAELETSKKENELSY